MDSEEEVKLESEYTKEELEKIWADYNEEKKVYKGEVPKKFRQTPRKEKRKPRKGKL